MSDAERREEMEEISKLASPIGLDHSLIVTWLAKLVTNHEPERFELNRGTKAYQSSAVRDLDRYGRRIKFCAKSRWFDVPFIHGSQIK